jgi:hypothetical protein
MNQSNQDNKSDKRIDKSTFMEYCQLPGIIFERFYQQFLPDDLGIRKSDFVRVLCSVYVSDL